MTGYRFEVLVMLKEGLLDPQAKAIEDSLPHMGWANVSNVRTGKRFLMTVEADSGELALTDAEEIAGRLLSNPVIESAEVVPMRSTGWPREVTTEETEVVP